MHFKTMKELDPSEGTVRLYNGKSVIESSSRRYARWTLMDVYSRGDPCDGHWTIN
jgi:hypothetical protein